MSKESGTRSGLLWEVERVLKELHKTDSLPQILLMENVPDVVGSKNIKDFNKWYSFLESLGYQSYYKILNAKNYSIPQNRNRCFMMSILGNYSYTFPKHIPLKKRLKDVLEPVVDEKYYLSDVKAQEFFEKANQEISNCIRTSGRGSLDRHTWDLVQVKQVGNCMTTNTRDNPNQGRIYDTGGLSPTLNCMGGGNRQPMICASRGRNSENPKSRRSGLPTVQMIEVNQSGCSNALTTVQKDNMVMKNQRIRRLTPLECWRLMGFSDEDFRKAEAVNSNTQLYSQAGNSIVKQVLMAIFKEMI